jgi:hypothetical protein
MTTSEASQKPSLMDSIILKALDQKGVRYRHGGITPHGFDCSGFIYFLYKNFSDTVPHSSYDMIKYGTSISKEDLQTGDLILFATGRKRNVVSHVGLYLGLNSMIHAASDGPRTGIIVTDLNESYWKNRIIGYRHPQLNDSLELPTELSEKIYNLEYSKGWYRGPTKAGLPQGRGFFFFRNGDTYVGDFIAGLAQGSGVYHWSNGSWYEGDFLAGKRNGLGVLGIPDQAKLSATWEEDQPATNLKILPFDDKSEIPPEKTALPPVPENAFIAPPFTGNSIDPVFPD